ncbi:DUF802 domain-containing protein [Ramlibacter sp. RBP-2]|uniref:DUF802 domain-containing protein n=1 Tax=Ramlibacter lithotrophicus TaxID=2606681 RepID=A0A7X6DJQ5_9BURK|nr:DUF802 domain-containing protein [Ramlibacter lithotrophicus]NKE68435.1 DUF802 domain-containing protein [Ramlibacter lithotrophicus]
MSKRFFAAAFAIGLLLVGWVGLGFAGSNWLAFFMTAAIAGVYLLGAFELRQFRAANAGLSAALADIPEPLAEPRHWLERVPASLRQAVRLRIEEERGALPGPALTPYLVGLLVMLGMLGTFVGMIVTFQGAVFALEGSADLQAMRAALAEPIKGLGLSFGTSVAGVAASAMLGLMSAISRRERLEVARQLDQRIATVLRPLSLSHQRRETFRALQAQAGALPRVADQLEALMERIEARGRQLDEQLVARQGEFHREATLAYQELARAVGASLQDSLAAGAAAAGASITPVVEAAMARIVQDSQQLHARLGDAAQAQVDALSERFGATGRELSEHWRAALQQQARAGEAVAGSLERALASFTQGFEQRSGSLLAAVQDSLALAQAQQADSEQRRLQAWTQLLAGSEELVRSRMATEARWLEQHGERMEQVAQAAAGVIDRLRDETSGLVERDNMALRERTALLEQLGSLLEAVNHAAGEQRAAIETLVASASGVLDQAAERFDQVLQAHAGRAADAAAHVAASSIELASVGEAFGQGMQLFQAANDKVIAALQRIEASLLRSTARSDEQLAYYVAQAREVIDLSIASQQGLVEHLRQAQATPLALVNGARR